MTRRPSKREIERAVEGLEDATDGSDLTPQEWLAEELRAADYDLVDDRAPEPDAEALVCVDETPAYSVWIDRESVPD